MVIVTEAFVTLARSLARSRGCPELPMVILPHPFETLSGAVVDRFARDKFAEILRSLTGSGTGTPAGRSSDDVTD